MLKQGRTLHALYTVESRSSEAARSQQKMPGRLSGKPVKERVHIGTAVLPSAHEVEVVNVGRDETLRRCWGKETEPERMRYRPNIGKNRYAHPAFCLHRDKIK
jgi:hypothetical protein